MLNTTRSQASLPGVAWGSGILRHRTRKSETGIRRYILATLITMGALAVAAPVASAQTSQPLNATYRIKIAGPTGTNPSCPGGANECGRGSDPTFGAFTYSAVFTNRTQVTTLTFATGVLVIDETYQEFTSPGNSGNSHSPPFAHGHPVTALATWSVDPSSSGTFTGATGNGTDGIKAAGQAANGVVAGTLNLT